VSIRTKLLVVLIVLGLVPMLLLSVGYYRSSTRAVEGLLREDVTYRVEHARVTLASVLSERETDLKTLARLPAVRAYARAPQAQTASPASSVSTPTTAAALTATGTPPEDVRAALAAVVESQPDYFAALALVGADGRPLFGYEPSTVAGGAAVYKAADVLSADTLPADVLQDWRAHAQDAAAPVSRPYTRAPFAAGRLRYILPIPADETADKQPPAGAIVAQLKLDALLDQVEAGLTNTGPGARSESRQQLVVLDKGGQVVYHTNRAYKFQPVGSVMPDFAHVAQAMTKGASGAEFYEAGSGQRWLAAYAPVPELDLSLAVTTNAAAADAGPRLIGLIGIAVTILTALATAVALTIVVERTSRRINRVAEAAAEIAAGNLEQRIEVRSTDETRLLAESFNLMSDRLREHIAHEAETKQFQSFLRLSAMLAHDLKNSITGLSILVGNMERHLHREEFRADAISSLRAATDKLRGIVARLNEPARTLSGEYRQAIRETDLVPLIRRVVAATAEPAAALHHIDTELPDKLVAPVDGERIERVLENLILNALEAMGGKSGRLTIAAGKEDEWHVFLRVCDTGIGMTEEFINTRLFRPFATTKEKGIGLGVYTCREVVAAHGGRLDVQSEVGAGTCFRVVLPSTPITRPSQPSAARSRQTTEAQGRAGSGSSLT
jgi:signal transduction histidine kinase